MPRRQEPREHLTEMARAAADVPTDNPLHGLYHEAIDATLDQMRREDDLGPDE
ncbi:hypothetical protein ABZ650_20485 [Streptomyces griseoviridis]|uniref:hypothetical protein n=1 Tax=Streptomyces griseoviridis TaxID=45398 RepID=UPI0033C9180B